MAETDIGLNGTVYIMTMLHSLTELLSNELTTVTMKNEL